MFTKYVLRACIIVGALYLYSAPVSPARSSSNPKAYPIPQTGTRVSTPVLPSIPPKYAGILVTANTVGLPLGNALPEISSSLSVELSVSREIADQRVTLCGAGQTLPQFMEGIVRTLSHNSDTPSGYFWEAERVGGTSKPLYRLKRAPAARIAERQALEKPRQEALQSLQNMRSAARRADNLSKKSDPTNEEKRIVAYGLDRYNQAVKELSDRQLKQLLDGKVMVVANKTDPAAYVVQGFNVSERTHDPTKSDEFGIRLINVSPTAWRGLTIARGFEKTGYLPENQGAVAKIYDLTPLLNAPGVTDEQRADLAFTLSALARATGLSLYEEHFIRQVGTFVPNTKGLSVRKGTLPQLVNAICKQWEYQVNQNQKGSLLFWSRHWAQDKQSDISERTLAPWRQILAKNNRFTEAEYTDMAQKLSYAQVRITLPFAFGIGENAPWNKSAAQAASDWDRFSNLWSFSDYKARRLTAVLLPGEREAALSPNGIAVAELSNAARQRLLNEFHFWNEPQAEAQRKGDFSVPGPTLAQISQSRLFLSKSGGAGSAQPALVQERVGDLSYDPLSLTIKSDSGVRWE